LLAVKKSKLFLRLILIYGAISAGNLNICFSQMQEIMYGDTVFMKDTIINGSRFYHLRDEYKDGKWKLIHHDEDLRYEIQEYRVGVPIGIWQTVSREDKSVLTTKYANGKMVKQFFCNNEGKITYSCELKYDNGDIYEKCKEWYDSGKLKISWFLINGKNVGELRNLYESGMTKSIQFFKIDSSGNIIELEDNRIYGDDRNFNYLVLSQKDTSDGAVHFNINDFDYSWYPNGKKRKHFVVKRKRNIMKELNFYSNGIMKSIKKFRYGYLYNDDSSDSRSQTYYLHGKCKYYSSNGKKIYVEKWNKGIFRR